MEVREMLYRLVESFSRLLDVLGSDLDASDSEDVTLTAREILAKLLMETEQIIEEKEG